MVDDEIYPTQKKNKTNYNGGDNQIYHFVVGKYILTSPLGSGLYP